MESKIYYSLSNSPFQNDLQENGYAVIPHVLTPDECQHWINEFWIAMQKFIPEATEETVCQPDSPWIHHLGGLIQSGFNHAPFMWWVRCHPKILDIAEQIYGTRELSVSFDGIAVERAPERRRNVKGRKMTRASYDSKTRLQRNYHNDRNSKYRASTDIHIQMEVPMNDVDDGDATLMVLVNSHKYYDEFVRQFPHTLSGRKDWRPLELEEKMWFLSKPDVRELDVGAPKGSLILWDTKTVHSNKRATEGREHPKFRYVAFVAYNLMSKLSDDNLLKRMMMFDRGNGSDTWGIQAFPDKPGARYPVPDRKMDDSSPCPKLFCIRPISLEQWGGQVTNEIWQLVSNTTPSVKKIEEAFHSSSLLKKRRLELENDFTPEGYAEFIEEMKSETPSMRAYMLSYDESGVTEKRKRENNEDEEETEKCQKVEYDEENEF